MSIIKHKQVWAALDALAAAHGLSPSGLARKAGLDSTSFNASKREKDGKERWPSTESLAKVLTTLHVSFEEFARLCTTDLHSLPRRLPVLGKGAAGLEGFFDADGYPTGQGWDEMDNGIRDPHAYALEISGNSMEPLYRDGDCLIISPHAEIRRGDRVVVFAGDRVLIKELERQSAANITLRSLNPAFPDPIRLERGAIRHMHRVLWVSQ